MSIVGQVLLYIGIVAVLLGYFGICFCAFAVSIGRGLLSLLFPFIGFGVAMRRFPWLIWLWGGGFAFLALGAILT